ncbi:MAG: RluA family pseudouridine synthase [Myxococcota bacterium]
MRLRPSAPNIVVGRDPAIVFRDDALVVVWKPAGLLSVPAAGRVRDKSLVGVVGQILGQTLYAVHRLDELTSGLMMIARAPQVQETMRVMFAAHEIERRYLAIVRGVFPTKPTTIRSIMVRDRGDGLRGQAGEDVDASDPTSKHAVTHFTLVEQLGSQLALVEAHLETGRTHQVRIHLAEMGHPVLGDGLYGGQGAGRTMARYALHAYVLGFRHPVTAEQLRFESPLADDLEKFLRAKRTGSQLTVGARRGKGSRCQRP